MTTRRYRLNRLAQRLENEADAAAIKTARIVLEQALDERTAPGIAPLASADLARLFAADANAAYTALAAMSEAQLTNQAIEYAMWLEGHDTQVRWIQILDCWQRKLAARAAAAAAVEADWADLLERADRGQLVNDQADAPIAPITIDPLNPYRVERTTPSDPGDEPVFLVVDSRTGWSVTEFRADREGLLAAYRACNHLWRTPRTVVVPSRSTPGKSYEVTDGRCTCKAAQYGRVCWHVQAAA
jgi:hypothetical protein